MHLTKIKITAVDRIRANLNYFGDLLIGHITIE
ncbi:Uncharacterised protein [Vibrio cholerae]|nr:Uncharacterised protein [Vibrio cholerae]